MKTPRFYEINLFIGLVTFHLANGEKAFSIISKDDCAMLLEIMNSEVGF